jgi:hypothetical protein
MSISEPEPWSFNDEEQFKKYESEGSSTDDSDDEEIFSKNIKGKKFKKLVQKEKLSFE